MTNESIDPSIQSAGVGEAFVRTLGAVEQHGLDVPADDSNSIGSGKPTRELPNFLMTISNPRDRIINNPRYRTNLVTSVARFIWMMAASDRLADIAFYEPRVRGFSDDGIAISGSNYGMRMLSPRPGLNQLRGIITELRQHPSSRRAMITIYHAEDSTRQESKDIPCTFGFGFLIRDGKLQATTIMRSNNAVSLLPFNLFEFSLLAEVVATEVGVSLGPLSHFAMSMHIYETDRARAKEIVKEASGMAPFIMPPMPAKPLNAIQKLASAEAELRHCNLSDANLEEWIRRPEVDGLDVYWHPFFQVLLFHAAGRVDSKLANTVRSAIPATWARLLPEVTHKSSDQSEPTGGLFGAAEMEGPANVINILDTPRMKSLRALLEKHEINTGVAISSAVTFGLQERFSQLAARSGEKISQSEFDSALEGLSKGRK